MGVLVGGPLALEGQDFLDRLGVEGLRVGGGLKEFGEVGASGGGADGGFDLGESKGEADGEFGPGGDAGAVEDRDDLGGALAQVVRGAIVGKDAMDIAAADGAHGDDGDIAFNHQVPEVVGDEPL